MSASSDIIEKIKKLLRLARSSNPHEAQLAMQRALELASEHDVQVENLNPDEQAKEKIVTHRDTESTQRLSYDKEYSLRICKVFFRVSPVLRDKIVWDRYDIPHRVKYATFVGVASDVEIALYVYAFLVHHFAYCWRMHHGRLRNRHAFIGGMFSGLYTKLQERQPEFISRAHALTVRTYEDYIAAIIGETEKYKNRKPSADAHAARHAGYVQGQRTNIAPALKPREETAPLALYQ